MLIHIIRKTIFLRYHVVASDCNNWLWVKLILIDIQGKLSTLENVYKTSISSDNKPAAKIFKLIFLETAKAFKKLFRKY